MSVFQKLMMTDIKKEESTLPGGYTQLEYIEATGTQYIDTGISPTINTKATVIWSTSSISGIQTMFGSYNTSIAGSSSRFQIYTNNENVSAGIGNNSLVSMLSITADTKYKSVFDGGAGATDSASHTLYDASGTQLGQATGTLAFTATAPTLYLFSSNRASLNNGSGKIWNCILEDNNTLVRNFIPAKRNSDSVLGMYDTVTETFFTNAGTGDFTAGPEIDKYPLEIPKVSYDNNAVNYSMYGDSSQNFITIDDVQYKIPTGYTVLDYIGTTGTQYINTGIVPTLNTKARVKFSPTLASVNGYFGARSESGRFTCTTFNSGTYFAFAMTSTYWSSNKTALTLDEVYDCIAYNGKQIINGTEYDETVLTEFNETDSFYLGLYNNMTSYVYSNAKYYLAEFWESNVLTHLLIPMKRNSDSEIGMYDFVTNTFFTNAGTGTFTAGTEGVSPDRVVDVVSVGDKVSNLWTGDTFNGFFGASLYTTQTINARDNTKMYYFPIESGKTYTVSSASCNRFRVGLSTSVPAEGGTVYVVYIDDTEQEHLYTFTNTTYSYCCVQVVNNATEPSWFMANEGDIPYGYQIPTVVGSNCGVVDLGSLNWYYNSTWNLFSSTTSTYPSTNNLYVKGYSVYNKTSSKASMPDMNIATASSGSGNIYIKNTSYTDATAFKQAMSGVYLYYQRQTDLSWTAPSITTTYLSEPLRAIGNYSDYLYWGEGKNILPLTLTSNGTAIRTSRCTASISGNRLVLTTTEQGDTFFGSLSVTTGTSYSDNWGVLMPVKAGSYYFFSSENNVFPATYICFFDSDKKLISYATIGNTYAQAPSGAEYASLRIGIGNTTVEVGTVVSGWIQLAEGTTATEFKPYSLTPKVIRNIGVKVFDGTENWILSRASTYNLFYTQSLQTTSIAESVCMCTHYSYGRTSGKNNTCFINSNKNFCIWSSDDTMTVTEFKSWLASEYANGNPVIVYYPLATPTTETITDIPALPLKAGTDEITVNTTVVPSAINLKAWQWRF